MEINYIINQEENPQYISLYNSIDQVRKPSYLMSQDYIQQESDNIKNNEKPLLNPLIEKFDQVIEKQNPSKQDIPKEDNVDLETLLKQEGVHFKVTSHIRNTKTSKGTKSYHSTGLAYDIKPSDGNTYDDLRNEIYSNPRIVSWMKSHNMGILEETDKRRGYTDYNGKFHYTGATGPHWHFGPDKAAVSEFNYRLINKAQDGMKLDMMDERMQPYQKYISIYNNNIANIKKPSYVNDDQIEQSFTLPKVDLDIANNEDINKEDNVFNNIYYIPFKKMTPKTKGYNNVKESMDKQISDNTKKEVLLQIAYNESNYNPSAKNPTSSASGLFGFIDSTKKKFGYGPTVSEQIAGASKLYDYNKKLLDSYTSKYGTRGKTEAQLMYGMWFRPQSVLNYLQTGKDNYKDKQGTSLDRIFSKMN